MIQLSPETKAMLWNRFKSFLWRAGGMFVIGLIAFVLQNLDVLHLSPALVGFIGLVLGEVTKWINDKLATQTA